jgi:putative endonuclease
VYCTYIIESATSGKWYYGSTSNPIERLNYHNKGWNRSTKGRGPWILIFLRKFETEVEAREFEFQLKGFRRKDYIRKKFDAYFLTLIRMARLAPT